MKATRDRRQGAVLTPQGYAVAWAAWQGRVVWLTRSDQAVLREQQGGFGDLTDVTGQYWQLRQAGWLTVPPTDPLEETPAVLPVLVTEAGEEALMEYQAAQRAAEQRKQQQERGGKR